MIWAVFLLIAAAPFWESKAPADWTEDEIKQLFTDSPWAQALTGPGNAPGVTAFLATAGPIEQAERERARRFQSKSRKKSEPDPMAEEYRLWLEDNHSTQIVLAIPIGDLNAFAGGQDTQRMEDECVMRVGRKKIKMTGHFPPSHGDPFLRLAFPRQVSPSDKSVTFDLYLPGVAMPFRTVEFRVKDMIVKGRLEM